MSSLQEEQRVIVDKTLFNLLGAEKGDVMHSFITVAGYSMKKVGKYLKDRPPDTLGQCVWKGINGDEEPRQLQELLDENQIRELGALYPFLRYAQNDWGPLKTGEELDHSTLTREEFEDFLEDVYDPDVRDHYDIKLARASEVHRVTMRNLRENREKASSAPMGMGSGNNHANTGGQGGGYPQVPQNVNIPQGGNNIPQGDSNSQQGSNLGGANASASGGGANSASGRGANSGRAGAGAPGGGGSSGGSSASSHGGSSSNAGGNGPNNNGAGSPPPVPPMAGYGSSRPSNVPPRPPTPPPHPPLVTPAIPQAPVPSAATLLLLELSKAIKKDMKHYIKFDKENDFHEWWRHTMGVLDLHDMSNVADGNYVPQGTDEELLFDKQCKFVGLAMGDVVKVDAAKDILESYENCKYGTQRALADIKTYYSNISSLTAEIAAENILASLTTEKLSSTNRDNPYAGQSIAFRMKLRRYNRLMKPSAKLSPDMQLIYYKNFVSEIEELKDTNMFIKLAIKKNNGIQTPHEAILMYEDRLKMLDDEFRNALRRRRRLRRTHSSMAEGQLAYVLDAYNIHSTDIIEDDPDWNRIQAHNVSLLLSETQDSQVNNASLVEVNYGGVRGGIGKDRWDSLSGNDKEKFDGMSADGKNIVAGLSPPNPRRDNNRNNNNNNNNRRSSQAQQPRQNNGSDGNSRSVSFLEQGGDDNVRSNATNNDFEDDGNNVILNNKAMLVPNGGNDQGLSILATIRKPVSAEESMTNAIRARGMYPPGHISRILSEKLAIKDVTSIKKIGENSSSEPKNGGQGDSVVQNLKNKILRKGKFSGSKVEGDSFLVQVNQVTDPRLQHTVEERRLEVRGMEPLPSPPRNQASRNGFVDGGTTYGFGGPNMHLIAWSSRTADISIRGFGNAVPQEGFRFGTFGTLAEDVHGRRVILIFNEYLGHPSESIVTLHPPIQIRESGHIVDDRLIRHGGRQEMVIGEHTFRLESDRGHIMLNTRLYTPREWNELPHEIVTRDMPWNPSGYSDNRGNRDIMPRERMTIGHDLVESLIRMGRMGGSMRRNELVMTDTVYDNLHQDTAYGNFRFERAAHEEIRRLQSIMALEQANTRGDGDISEDSSDDDSLPSLESYIGTSNGDNTNETNRDSDDEDYVQVDHDDVFPTGDDNKYFDKKGQIINGKVLAADKCAHSIDMVAVHRNIENVAEHVESRNIGSRMLQQIRETGSDTNVQMKMRFVVKHDGRCKARLVVD